MYQLCRQTGREELLDQWHPTKNLPLTPDTVSGGSSRRVWWRCGKGHEWQSAVYARVSAGAGCPYCSGKLAVPGQTDLASRFPEVAFQWHPTKNAPLTPDQVLPGSHRLVWWLCKKGHEWQAVVAARTMGGSGCPYCAGRKALAGFNDLATLAPEVAAQWYWTLNGSLTPEQVTAGSRRKVWWECPYGHVWKAAIYSRTGEQHSGCPVCAGKARSRRAPAPAAWAANQSNSGIGRI